MMEHTSVCPFTESCPAAHTLYTLEALGWSVYALHSPPPLQDSVALRWFPRKTVEVIIVPARQCTGT